MNTRRIGWIVGLAAFGFVVVTSGCCCGLVGFLASTQAEYDADERRAVAAAIELGATGDPERCVGAAVARRESCRASDFDCHTLAHHFLRSCLTALSSLPPAWCDGIMRARTGDGPIAILDELESQTAFCAVRGQLTRPACEDVASDVIDFCAAVAD